MDVAAERRLVQIADLLWQVQKRFSRGIDSSPLSREEIEAMKLASSDVHGIVDPTPGLGRFADPPRSSRDRPDGRARPARDDSAIVGPHETGASPWHGAIQAIQIRALAGPATEGRRAILEWLRRREPESVDLYACQDFARFGSDATAKLVYCYRRQNLHDDYDDVAVNAIQFAHQYGLSYGPGIDLRFLLVAVDASSVSMTRIASDGRVED